MNSRLLLAAAALGAVTLSGCAVYASPPGAYGPAVYGPPPAVYVGPPVVGPTFGYGWRGGYGRGWGHGHYGHGHHHHRGWR